MGVSQLRRAQTASLLGVSARGCHFAESRLSGSTLPLILRGFGQIRALESFNLKNPKPFASGWELMNLRSWVDRGVCNVEATLKRGAIGCRRWDSGLAQDWLRICPRFTLPCGRDRLVSSSEISGSV